MDLLSLVQDINGILWNYVLIFLLCGTGIYYTFRLRFVQVRLFGAAFKKAFAPVLKKMESRIGAELIQSIYKETGFDPAKL